MRRAVDLGPGGGERLRSGSLDVDVDLAEADDDDNPGNNTIIWDVVEVSSNRGITEWEVRDYSAGPSGVLLWTVVEDASGSAPVWDINDSGDQLECEIASGVLTDSGSNTDLLEVSGSDINVAGGGAKVYEFDGTDVLDATGTPLLETSVDQESATEGRRLVIAALMAGECGSGGLP